MDPISSFYLTQGVLGATVAALIIVVVYQTRKIDSLQKELKESLLLRLSDSKEYNQSYAGTVEKYAVLSEKGLTSDSLVMQTLNGIAGILQNRQNPV